MKDRPIFYIKYICFTPAEKKKLRIKATGVFAHNKANARKVFERIIKQWKNVESCEILQISTVPFILKKYEIGLFVRDEYCQRSFKLRVRAEDKNEVEFLVKKIISGWKDVGEYMITSINESKLQNVES